VDPLGDVPLREAVANDRIDQGTFLWVQSSLVAATSRNKSDHLDVLRAVDELLEVGRGGFEPPTDGL
jgi:hypothetical protein